MVQRVRPQVSGIFSFYSIKRDLFPTRVRRWSCLGGSLPISCGSGVSTKVLVLNFSGNSPEGRDPSPGSRLAVEAQRLEWRYKCEPTKVVVFVPCKELRNSTVQY